MIQVPMSLYSLVSIERRKNIMSDNGTITTTSAPESSIAIAITLGSLRSDVQHHMEDNAREHDELEIRLAEAIEARETAHAELETRLDELTGHVETAVTAMHEYLSRNGSAQHKTKAAATSPPTRADREGNKAFHVRLLAWAESKGVEAPPKPKGTEFNNAYDKRVQEWQDELGP